MLQRALEVDVVLDEAGGRLLVSSQQTLHRPVYLFKELLLGQLDQNWLFYEYGLVGLCFCCDFVLGLFVAVAAVAPVVVLQVGGDFECREHDFLSR